MTKCKYRFQQMCLQQYFISCSLLKSKYIKLLVWIHYKWNKHLIFDILQLSFMLHVKHFIRIIIMFNLSRNIDNFKKLLRDRIFLTIRFKIHWKFVYCQVLFLYHWHAYLLYLWQTFPSWNLILAAYYVCTVILWITNAFWMIAQGYVRL